MTQLSEHNPYRVSRKLCFLPNGRNFMRDSVHMCNDRAVKNRAFTPFPLPVKSIAQQKYNRQAENCFDITTELRDNFCRHNSHQISETSLLSYLRLKLSDYGNSEWLKERVKVNRLKKKSKENLARGFCLTFIAGFYDSFRCILMIISH